MGTTIVVVDGLGGGAGAQMVERLRKALPGVQLVALATNAVAAQRMVEAGADRGASGENAIRVSVNLGDVVVGPLGMVIPDSMMGEVTAPMAQAIANCRGRKFFLPLHQSHFTLVGLEQSSMAELMAGMVQAVKASLEG